MTTDTGADQAANDTADSTVTQAADTTQDTQTQTPADDGEGEELDADGNPVVRDETEELEWDGKKWALPKDVVDTLKPALLRRADYTQKTQSVAEARKALDAEREAFGTASKEVIEARVQAHTLGQSVKRYDDYFKTPEWVALQEQDPTLAQRHWLQYSQFTKQLADAEGTVRQRENDQTLAKQRERATQFQHVQTELPKIIKDFTPELGKKLEAYGIANGLSQAEMDQAVLLNPKFAKIVHTAFLADEAAKKLKTTQTFTESQQAKPVTRVGGNSGTASRRTTDSSGDALSAEEWAKRERARTAPAARR